MSDVNDLILYFRSLKKGFNTEIFSEKTKELELVIYSTGLNYEDFHTLFKVWLNLSISVSKWINLGSCLIPQEKIQAPTVHYALRWLLVNCQVNNFSRVSFLLDWFTAAIDSNSIDMKSLDMGYEIFMSLFEYQALSSFVLKILYTLSRPMDVNRTRVLKLLELIKLRDGVKSKCRQVNILLGLFKSYRPECVPECIPAITIPLTLRQRQQVLLTRFNSIQSSRSPAIDEPLKLYWTNPIKQIIKGGKNKKVQNLIPDMEFVHMGSRQYSNEAPKTYIDFKEPSSLLSYSTRHAMARPARLRSMLCNDTTMALLAVSSSDAHAFLSHDLNLLLQLTFFNDSHHTYEEKADLLLRLALFQRTAMQGVPVVTRFLAEMLSVWNQSDYFDEILQLLEWVSLESTDHFMSILEHLTMYFPKLDSIRKCAVLYSLTSLYANLTYAKTRRQLYFLKMEQSETTDYTMHMAELWQCIENMSKNSMKLDALQGRDDAAVMCEVLFSLERLCCAELRYAPSVLQTPSIYIFALPLFSVSASLLEKLALILHMYHKMFIKNQSKSPETNLQEQKAILTAYTIDCVNALWYSEPFSQSELGIIFSKLRPNTVKRLFEEIPDLESSFRVDSHAALAPYTYLQFTAIDANAVDKRLWLDNAIAPEFPNIYNVLSKFH